MTCKRCSDTGTDLISYSDVKYYSDHGSMPSCACKNTAKMDDVWAWIENKEEEEKFIQAMMLHDLTKWRGV